MESIWRVSKYSLFHCAVLTNESICSFVYNLGGEKNWKNQKKNRSVTPTTDRPRRQSAQQAKQKINTHFTKGEPAFPALVEEEPDDLDDDFILDDDELMPKGECEKRT